MNVSCDLWFPLLGTYKKLFTPPSTLFSLSVDILNRKCSFCSEILSLEIVVFQLLHNKTYVILLRPYPFHTKAKFEHLLSHIFAGGGGGHHDGLIPPFKKGPSWKAFRRPGLITVKQETKEPRIEDIQTHQCKRGGFGLERTLLSRSRSDRSRENCWYSNNRHLWLRTPPEQFYGFSVLNHFKWLEVRSSGCYKLIWKYFTQRQPTRLHIKQDGVIRPFKNLWVSPV